MQARIAAGIRRDALPVPARQNEDVETERDLPCPFLTDVFVQKHLGVWNGHFSVTRRPAVSDTSHDRMDALMPPHMAVGLVFKVTGFL